jgi:sn-glycerol 3-phosphate transport system permease protein
MPWMRLPPFPHVLLHLLLLFLGFVIVVPILIAISGSFSSANNFFASPASLLPQNLSFSNYIRAWNSQPLPRYLINSIIQTGVIVVFQTLSGILAAYAFSFLRFPARDTLFYIVLVSLMVPFQLTWVPNFLLISNLGWANTYAGLTIPFLASAFGVFLLRQFFKTLPQDYHDAAKLDGVSSWQFLWEIVVPMNRGAIATFVIFSFLDAWNQYMWPLIITNEVRMRTVQIGIHFLSQNADEGLPWPEVLASTLMMTLPTLAIFLIAQRQITKTIAATGLR